jgi:hypothetical protein
MGCSRGQTIPARPMGFNVTAPFEAETKLRQQLAAAAPQPLTGSRSAEISEYTALSSYVEYTNSLELLAQ